MKLVSDNSKRPPKRTMPCRCGFLERHANSPDSPIRFDPELNEYHFVHQTSEGNEALMMIYHRPFCGGKAPKSRRDELFHRLSQAEQIRLSKLTKDLRTIDEVRGALGESDFDSPTGLVVTTPGHTAPVNQSSEAHYSGLSSAMCSQKRSEIAAKRRGSRNARAWENGRFDADLFSCGRRPSQARLLINK